MKEPYVLCLDGSPFSDRALDWCLKYLDAQRDPIHVLQINEKPGRDEGKQQIQSVEEQARTRLESDKYKVRTKILTNTGSPGPLICRYAEQKQARAIVMGRRGQSAVMGWLAGSVSQYVYFNATRPVLTIPQPTETTYYHWDERMHRDLIEQLLDIEFNRRHAQHNDRRTFPSLKRQPDIRCTDEHGESNQFAYLLRPSELHKSFFQSLQKIDPPFPLTFYIPSQHIQDVKEWLTGEGPKPALRSYRIFNGILVTNDE